MVDWTNYIQVDLSPDGIRKIYPPLNQLVKGDWEEYHQATQNPIDSTTAFALISRSRRFAYLCNGGNFRLSQVALGYGKEDSSLKGRNAGLLISRGHSASEAIKVANGLSRLDLPQKDSNAIGSKKQSIAFPGILQLCEAHKIEITCQKQAAVTKLQKFWRTKVQKKPEAIDLAIVVIPTGTFAIAGVGVDVQRVWTPTTVGVSMGTKEQLQPYLNQAQRLTSQ